jgi:hypothetical protein
MDYIAIYPEGGLCNKLRVTLSYYQFAKSKNKQLIVIWDITSACNGFFLDYFEPIENITFIKNYSNNYKIFYNGFSIHQDYPLYIIPELKLLPFMIDEIKKKLLILENNYIAVHVRRTDHINDAKNNNLFTTDEEFYNFIETNMNENNKFNLYVATDNKNTYNIFKNKYKNKLKIDYHNELFNSLRHTSLKDSIIDLYMCAYSNNFKGSGWSSFTETIVMIRNKKI